MVTKYDKLNEARDRVRRIDMYKEQRRRAAQKRMSAIRERREQGERYILFKVPQSIDYSKRREDWLNIGRSKDERKPNSTLRMWKS